LGKAKYNKNSKRVKTQWGEVIILVAYLFVKGDIEWAITNLGIVLVFDPYDAEVKWQNRQFYQKVWPFAHFTLTFIGFIYLILR
jgi:hypothetical protein